MDISKANQTPPIERQNKWGDEQNDINQAELAENHLWDKVMEWDFSLGVEPQWMKAVSPKYKFRHPIPEDKEARLQVIEGAAKNLGGQKELGQSKFPGSERIQALYQSAISYSYTPFIWL